MKKTRRVLGLGWCESHGLIAAVVVLLAALPLGACTMGETWLVEIAASLRSSQ